MTRRVLMLLFGGAALSLAQKYDGPRPAKPDLPYLKHADTLLATEAAEATEEHRKQDVIYVVSGEASPVKTPLSSPILLLQSDKIAAEKLQLFKLESKNGRREILFTHKNKQAAKPIRIDVSKLSSDNIYKIEVTDSLDKGEYSLTPDGSNQVFCFQVY